MPPGEYDRSVFAAAAMRSHVLRLLQLYCAGVVAGGNGAVRTGSGDVGGGSTAATATTSNHDQDQGGSTAPSHSFAAVYFKLQGSVATRLRCGGIVNNQIRKDLLLSLSVNFFKSVNIWQSYKQERDCLMHFFVFWQCVVGQARKVHETTTLLLGGATIFSGSLVSAIYIICIQPCATITAAILCRCCSWWQWSGSDWRRRCRWRRYSSDCDYDES